MTFSHRTVPIVPCRDLDASAAFYARLGFAIASDYPHHGYRILADARGAAIHLTRVAADAIDPGNNAAGVYFYSDEVDALAAKVGATVDAKPWGLREFAVSDPDGTLVRVGWPG